MKRATVALAVVVAAACGDSGAGGPSTTQTIPPPANESGSVSTLETSLGTVLVDPDGMTMYIFTPDRPDESVCYESCAVLWPPVPGDVAIGSGLNPSMFGTTTRTDGSSQLTVNGQPLYLWVSDTSPGDVTGQDVDNVWFVVGPDGEMIGGPGGQTGGSEDPSDY